MYLYVTKWKSMKSSLSWSSASAWCLKASRVLRVVQWSAGAGSLWDDWLVDVNSQLPQECAKTQRSPALSKEKSTEAFLDRLMQCVES